MNRLSDIRIPLRGGRCKSDARVRIGLIHPVGDDSPVFDSPLPSVPEVSSLPMAAWILEHDGSSQISDLTSFRAPYEKNLEWGKMWLN